MLTSPARLSQRCRLGGPAHTAAAAGISTQEGEVWRETDCLLEGNGFEISVPRQIGSGFEASVGLGPIDSRRGGTTRAVVGLGKPIELFRRHKEPPLTPRNEGAHAVGGGEASPN